MPSPEEAVVVGKVVLAVLLSGVVLAGLLSSRATSGPGRAALAILGAALAGAAAGSGHYLAAIILATVAFGVLFVHALFSGDPSTANRVDDESPH